MCFWGQKDSSRVYVPYVLWKGRLGGGGAGYVCAKEKIQGMEFVNQRIEISRINDILTDVWGGGVIVVYNAFLYSISKHLWCKLQWWGICSDRLFRGHSRVLVKESYCWHVLYILYRCIVMLFIRLLANKLKQMMKCVFYL